jgi:alkanesulfonate monooxygenase SsuD/methylene tetrahydromethanopterin reductase-like flavin-dependent oxidoreductase (luciferase family)
MSIRYIARLVVPQQGLAATARMFDTPEQATEQIRAWVRRGAVHCSVMAVPSPDVDESPYGLN